MSGATCRKRRFDRVKALLVVEAALRSDRWHRQECRAYRCPECRAWHVTKQSRRGRIA